MALDRLTGYARFQPAKQPPRKNLEGGARALSTRCITLSSRLMGMLYRAYGVLRRSEP